nr:multidrug efflux SMR transporter [Rubellimicrobium arenae]
MGLAIVSEVIGSSFLQKSEQFTKLLPSLAVLVFYAAAFVLLSQALKALPLGVAYAIWAGVGIVLTAGIGVVVFRQSLDGAALLGIALIVAGVVVMQAFSSTVSH